MIIFLLFLILLINIFKLNLLYYFYQKNLNNNNNIGIDLIFYFLTVNTILYGIIVNIIRIYSGGKVFLTFGVTIFELLQVELIEFFSFLIFLCLIVLFFKSKYFKCSDIKNQTNTNTYPFLLLLNILSIFNFFLSDPQNQFLFSESLKYLSGPSSILLIFYCLRYKKFNLIFIPILNLSIMLFIVFSTGVRGPIIGLLLIFIFLLYKYYSFKYLLKKIHLILIPILLIVFFNNQYSKIKTAFTSEYLSNPKGFQSVTDIAVFIYDFYKYKNYQVIENGENKPLEEIEFRLGARSMYSIGFLRFVSSKGFTYAKPILNTLYVFYPRIFFDENKPYPDSYDGQISGMGMYVCANEIDGGANMTDFYASSHYYWQIGFIGIFLFSILSSFYILLLIIISSKQDNFFALIFIIYSLKPYYFIPQFTISDTILMIVTKILPFLIFFIIFKWLFKYKNLLNKK